MDITLQALAEWRAHPITDYIFKSIKEEVHEHKLKRIYQSTKSSEEIALEATYLDGMIDGFTGLENFHDVLKHHLSESQEG